MSHTCVTIHESNLKIISILNYERPFRCCSESFDSSAIVNAHIELHNYAFHYSPPLPTGNCVFFFFCNLSDCSLSIALLRHWLLNLFKLTVVFFMLLFKMWLRKPNAACFSNNVKQQNEFCWFAICVIVFMQVFAMIFKTYTI